MCISLGYIYEDTDIKNYSFIDKQLYFKIQYAFFVYVSEKGSVFFFT